MIEQSAPGVITVTEVEETDKRAEPDSVIAPETREGQGIMNVLKSLWGFGGPQKNEPQPLESSWGSTPGD